MSDITRHDLRELRDDIRRGQSDLKRDLCGGLSRVETQLIAINGRVRKTEMDLVALQARQDEAAKHLTRTATKWAAGIGGGLALLLEMGARWLG